MNISTTLKKNIIISLIEFQYVYFYKYFVIEESIFLIEIKRGNRIKTK